MRADELMASITALLLTQKPFTESLIPGWLSVPKEIFQKLILADRSLPETNRVICFLGKMRVCTRYILQLPILKPPFPTRISISGSTVFPILPKLYKKL